MTDQSLIVKSSINSSLMHYILFRGTAIAGIGAILLLISGAFFPESILRTRKEISIWGGAIFFLGFGLIACGLLPYRKIKRLETSPYILSLEKQGLSLIIRGKLLVNTPIKLINEIEWLQKGHTYGIKIHLKKPLSQQMIRKIQNLDATIGNRFLKQDDGCTLFFPYFSKQAYQMLTAPKAPIG